ncbi:hypothetical protein, partial [Pseudonocardia sp.]|uniref:hypothetical protein n=1 Tax=Pseudonocardia sp. TaxID=60912 RepID=UPI0031FCD392
MAGTVAAGALGGGRPHAVIPSGAPTPPPGGGSNEDDYNLEATQDGQRSIPFHGRYQAGIATPPQTAATFLA